MRGWGWDGWLCHVHLQQRSSAAVCMLCGLLSLLQLAVRAGVHEHEVCLPYNKCLWQLQEKVAAAHSQRDFHVGSSSVARGHRRPQHHCKHGCHPLACCLPGLSHLRGLHVTLCHVISLYCRLPLFRLRERTKQSAAAGFCHLTSYYFPLPSSHSLSASHSSSHSAALQAA